MNANKREEELALKESLASFLLLLFSREFLLFIVQSTTKTRKAVGESPPYG